MKHRFNAVVRLEMLKEHLRSEIAALRRLRTQLAEDPSVRPAIVSGIGRVRHLQAQIEAVELLQEEEMAY